MLKKIILILAFSIVPIIAQAKFSEKKRVENIKMRGEVLTKLYKNNPETKSMIKETEGYAVFNNGGVNLIFLSASSGKGVTHDNKSGKNTFMRIATGGVSIYQMTVEGLALQATLQGTKYWKNKKLNK